MTERKVRKMLIKELGKKDVALLQTFLLWLTPTALKTWYHYGTTFTRQNVETILANSDYKLACLEKNKIVALGHLHDFAWKFYPEREIHHRRVRICRLGIVSGITGQGYGTLLLMELIEKSRLLKPPVEEIYLSVSAENKAAVKLYSNFGFKIIQEFNDRAQTNYEMVKKLD